MKNWDEARHLLCVRLDALGDVLMTEPALRALKQARPDRRITLLTSESGAAVARLIPLIDEVLVYDAPWLKSTAPRESARPDLDQVARLRDRGFDAAVIFTVYSQNPLPSALLCYLAEIPLRLAHCRENPYQLLTHWVRETEPHPRIRHEVRRQLDLVSHIGGVAEDERMSLKISEEAGDRVLRRVYEMGIEPFHPWAVIHPGATAPSRRYPPEKFAQVAQLLVENHGFEVIFTGSASEAELIETIRRELRVPTHSLAGELNLEEFAALLTAAPLLISNNTGSVHVAAACGTPVVDLYALTNPQHTPWQVPNRVLFHDVPCRYCYKSRCPEEHQDCLRKIEPLKVVDAAIELMHAVREGEKTTSPRMPPPQLPPEISSMSAPEREKGSLCIR